MSYVFTAEEQAQIKQALIMSNGLILTYEAGQITAINEQPQAGYKLMMAG